MNPKEVQPVCELERSLNTLTPKPKSTHVDQFERARQLGFSALCLCRLDGGGAPQGSATFRSIWRHVVYWGYIGIMEKKMETITL